MATKKSSRSAAPAVKARKTPATKKSSVRGKTPARKAPARKAPVRKAPVRKAPARKAAARGSRKGGGQLGTQLGRDMDTAWMKTWPRIVARAWSDPSFMDRLKSAPADVFKEFGLPLLPDFEYAVQSGTGRPLVTLSVPPKPTGAGNENVGDIVHEDGRARPKSCTNTCGF
ncbi:hypothetical protein HPC49_54140 [Pyxidicoccus fallax]|uniref:Uncharacterized protein n=1 Tax=Pyxidicoccus fallax TaxID=394095 RepID=A0A848LM28_9BACT|nr:hypothetical protein [Pyxidicoccus fallax]NMO18887.1 hypothetical protein [Pyxidicoccus fallax]NPC87108.1 hypothetical protein [Pyxidicoccus fallax]